MPELTITIPIVKTNFIEKCLETLYKYTEPELFRVILIDQTAAGVYEKIKNKVQIYIRPDRNWGFARAVNKGMALSDTEYAGTFNDDIEFMNKRWWQGIKDTFNNIPNLVAANPMSPKEPGWGYGEKGYRFHMEYKEEFSEGDYEFLFRKVRGSIEGLTCWGSIFKMDRLKMFLDSEPYNPHKIIFDERFHPGGGEDYDMSQRLYNLNFRAVSTSLSWVWHHWGQSKDKYTETKLGIINPEKDRPAWNKLNAIWTKDPYGTKKGPIFPEPMRRLGIVERISL